MSKLAKYTNKGGISLNGGKMVMLGGKKIGGIQSMKCKQGKSGVQGVQIINKKSKLAQYT